MNAKARVFLIPTLLLLAGLALVTASQATPAQGGAPSLVSYQGEVRLDGVPYSGAGYFKFAVVNAAGNTSYWSNDGTSSHGAPPTAPVKLAVSHGLFSVLLGDTSLGSMTALPASVFSEPDRYLRVWFGTSLVGPFSQLGNDTRIAAVPYALQAQEAVNADTVDGLHAGDLGGTHYQNVVVVAKSGGDYTTVQAAINSIADATADNPYLVWVAPGAYVEQVTMKPFVHLQGAGQEATIISSTASSTYPPTAATVKLASDTSLRDLTVANSGAGGYKVALLATAGTTRTLVADVTARAHGSGTYNYGIFLNGSGTGVTLQVTALAENSPGNNCALMNYDGAAMTLRGGSFTARGGTYARAIYNSQATLEAEGVTALAENGGENYGLFNYDAQATLSGGSFTARGGTEAHGIENWLAGATLEAESVTALGEDGSYSYGLSNVYGAATTLRGGSFTARGGTHAWAVSNQATDTTLKAEGIQALGEGGATTSYGLYNAVATATVDGSQFSGDSKALYQVSGTVRLGVSQLDGDALRDSGTLTCFQVYDGSYAAYTCP